MLESTRGVSVLRLVSGEPHERVVMALVARRLARRGVSFAKRWVSSATPESYASSMWTNVKSIPVKHRTCLRGVCMHQRANN